MIISVVTVCRNAESTIVDCMESVARQTYPWVEHLILDGASTDGTVAKIRSAAHSRVKCISEPDEGLYFAMNRGLAMARGDVIGFLHADDVFADDQVLERIASEFGDPAVVACYGDLQYVDAADLTRVVRDWKAGVFQPGMFGGGWMPPHPTFHARASVYQRFGGFDTRFSLGADWDLLMRLFEIKRIQVRYLPMVMVRMRLGGVSNRSWRNVWRNNLQCLRVFGKYGRRAPLRYPVAKLCHRLKQFR